MASASTEKKLLNIAPRQRLSESDLEIISELAYDFDAEDNYGVVAADNVVVSGCKVAFVSGREFRMEPGAYLINGELVKEVSNVSLGEQDAIVGGGDSRIDIVYIDPTNQTQDGTTDNATKTVMSAVSISSAAAFAVGTGDGVTATWDLGHEKIDLSTLKVYVGGTQVAGWVFSKGTGTAGVDQILFNVAPASGAITADYDYLVGGVESTSSVSTRFTRSSNPLVAKGTEAVSPSAPTGSLPSGAIELARITYPAGWSSGSSGVTIDNTVKSFLTNVDDDNETSSNTHTPQVQSAAGNYAGRLSYGLRGLNGLMHGFRLLWKSATQIAVSAGWAVCEGVACRSNGEITFSPSFGSDITGVGWYYVYLVIGGTDSTRPGSAPTLRVDTQAPDSQGRDTGQQGTLYVGAIYNTGAGSVAIREFVSRGDMFYWLDGLGSWISLSSGDNDLAAWCPATGREVYALARMTFSPASTSDVGELTLSSHKSGSLAGYPEIYMKLSTPVHPHTPGYFDTQTGFLLCEQYGSARYVNLSVAASGGGSISGALKVLGYRDDMRSMGSSMGTVSAR